jgi:hypothetical protein
MPIGVLFTQPLLGCRWLAICCREPLGVVSTSGKARDEFFVFSSSVCGGSAAAGLGFVFAGSGSLAAFARPVAGDSHGDRVRRPRP